MANEENLKKGVKTQFKAGEEQVKIAQKAGIASGVAKRKKKRMKELCDLVLNNKIQDERTIENLKERFPEIDAEDATFELMLILKQYEKAKDGDAKAFELLRDTSGQKPIEKQEVKNINSDGYMQVLINGEDEFNEDLEENNDEE